MKTNKLTVGDLKTIVKECLLEILSEGLSANDNTVQLREQLTAIQKPSNKRKSYLEKVTKGLRDGTVKKNHGFEKKVESVVENLTSDPILNEMLFDTAKTTLQEQNSAETRKGALVVPHGSGDNAQKIVSQAEPEELFGTETAGKWAQLAFAK